MSSIHTMRPAVPLLALAAALLMPGCGTPGAPQPPSLNLPDKVTDLTATRAGNQVTFTWTMPKRNTDKLLLKGNVPVTLCMREESSGDCAPVGDDVSFAPGAAPSVIEILPKELTAGTPRPLSYFVETRNRKDHTAGPSNVAVVLAGEAPAPVTDLTAEVHKRGVTLRWNSQNPAAPVSSPTAIRLHRKLLTPPPAKPKEGLLTPQPEPTDQNLLVDSCAVSGDKGLCRTLDKSIHFGQSYEYSAQRVARVTVEGKTLELAGEFSAPIRVEALDVFPPDVPTGLAAVATVGENGAAPFIDLSWQPIADVDLAGYAVYRREGEANWKRISPAESVIPPAFRDTNVQPGHSYRYAVSTIGQNGRESPLSVATEESVPIP